MAEQVADIHKRAETRMKAVVQATRTEFTTVRTGRANPSLLDRVTVDYYGSPTPLNQLASISAPEPRLLLIQPWDKSALKEVEKAIIKSDLGLTPTNDGQLIRISVPQLTEERRRDLVRVVRKEAEEKRVAIRNIRRDANDAVRKLEKDGDLSEDESRRSLTEIQEVTDRYVQEIDSVLEGKEKEIMEV